jgi:phosphoribosylformylglycinamidine synthase
VLDLGAEVALSKLLATPGLVTAAHDLSEGGLAVGLAELCLRSGCGARVALPDGADPLWGLFGESTARALVTSGPDDLDRAIGSAERLGVPARAIGRLGGSDLVVEGVLQTDIDSLRRAFDDAIPSLMDR